MDYFQILHLNKEPFSNSPDPEFFFPSHQHAGCLQKIEMAIRLRRGLNVVIGDVGTGKTTLCRHLDRKFADDKKVVSYVVFDPGFQSPREFLYATADLFGILTEKDELNEWQLKEKIKKYLFEQGVENQKITALIIDEGQKLPGFALELLREFLNYETNEYKLLQIIIFAQKEFNEVIKTRSNFADRINLCYILKPLNFLDTTKKIQFRLNRASEGRETPNLFTWPALWLIYQATGGYPRKILHLCHLVLLSLIIQNRIKAGFFLVRSCIKRDTSGRYRKWQKLPIMIILCLLVLVAGFKLAGQWNLPDFFKIKLGEDSAQIESVDLKSSYDKGRFREIFKANKPKTADDLKFEINTSFAVSEPVGFTQDSLSNNSFPSILGKITSLPQETLPEMIENIYGTFTSWHIDYVRMVNPHIKKPYKVLDGKVVNFPSIQANSIPIEPGTWLVEINKLKRLDDAYQFLRNHPEYERSHLLPYWNKREGLQFSILFLNAFEDKDSALNYLKKLPPIFASTGKIIDRWDPDTVFFSKLSLQELTKGLDN
ncbi:ATPase AAA [Candidatus Magnetomoraceae bacterium gMMP-13]